jgi:transcriptional regulator with XRE-family HTH domain
MKDEVEIMNRKKETSDAVEILRRRYIKGDPDRKAALEVERVNAEVARTIYDLRTDAGMSQKELADLIETTQSVISRLEDADYEGHSLSMLNRIAKALNQKLTVVMTAKDPEIGTLQYAFRAVIQDMRKAKGLTVSELARRTGIDHNELIAIERKNGYRPTPLTLDKLSRFFGISHKQLATLAGAFGESPPDIVESASRFAAQSESFVKLTKEERKALDEFMNVLKKEA